MVTASAIKGLKSGDIMEVSTLSVNEPFGNLGTVNNRCKLL